MQETQMKNELNMKAVRENGALRVIRSDRLPPLPTNFIVLPMQVLDKPEPIRRKNG